MLSSSLRSLCFVVSTPRQKFIAIPLNIPLTSISSVPWASLTKLDALVSCNAQFGIPPNLALTVGT
jgi:hypothetical protein